ncbi:MAG: hypothetical protein C7B45_04750 [Sulfobacillus acidophilus]|uniref:AMP-dependent ligase C-terminal domain-containing protein n=1 Tax=Sulfobacillus acidophilus TaxID=53633 RepID=A0A2T2WL19_9FIRM|nr:MAG: hypothetical protein C7B45_04750 [Sulfobacillus acidophilus]
MSQSLFWDPMIETLPRAQIESLQGMRLVRQVDWVYHNSEFYRQWYSRAGISPNDIHGLSDLTKLPTMSKDDLREWRKKTHDPFSGTLCVPPKLLVRMHHSTGTSGLPNVYGLTQKDWDDVTDQFARMLYRVGIRSGDVTNNWLESAMSWHGFTMTAPGARRIGATVYSLEPDNRSIAQTNLEMLAGADMTCLFTYHPEFEINYLRQRDLDPKTVHPNLRFIYSAALTTPTRRKLLEEAWGVPYWNMGGGGDQYLSESECPYSIPSMHMPEDRTIVEVLDPVTHEPVEPGQEGELTVTNLWAEACPYLRYRLEDIVRADYNSCPCGSTHVRLTYRGRMAWSVEVGGVRVFSDDVENVLWRFPATEFAQYQLVKSPVQPQPRLIVRTTRHADRIHDEVRFVSQLEDAIAEELQVPTTVQLVNPGQIGIGTVKFQRVAVESV